MSQIPNDPELKVMESALGGLIPVPSRLDRDRLMFQAGAISRRGGYRTRWAWPSIASVLAVIVVCESLYLAARPGPRVVERLVVVREPAGSSLTSSAPSPTAPVPDRGTPSPAPVVLLSQAVDPSPEPSDALLLSNWQTVSDYRRLENLVLRFGLDALPEPARRLSEPGTSLDPLERSPASAGAMRRIELEKLLNLGDRS